MATANPITLTHTNPRFSKSNPLEDLVSPRERLDVPNHIIETKLFNKIAQNSTTKVEPSVVNFAGYNLNRVHKRRFKICNSSAERQNLHIIPPATSYFSIKYTKPKRFVPGFTIDVVVTFIPDEWRYYYDCIRLHCKGEDNLVVPIHAFPVMDTSKFPPKLVFSDKGIVLGQNYTQVLPLFSYCPVEFEFEINILQSHPSFKVYPQSGVISGESKTNIHVMFTPTEYVTAHMSMQLNISQFNTKPMLCEVTASCQPPETNYLTRSVKDFDELYKQTNLLDPRAISPVQIARRRQKSIHPSKSQSSTSSGFERGGYHFPPKIHSQHAVSKVLMQEKGKLRMKDLREAILDKANISSNAKSGQTIMSAETTAQMKGAAFEMIVRQDAVEERANQLRWQVHLGDQPMTDEARASVLKHREIASHRYKFVKRKDPDQEEEVKRVKSRRSKNRTWRRANQIAASIPAFDSYKNDPWSTRQRAIDRFQQAARTILIRCRAQKKAVLLRKMIEDFKKERLPESRSSGTLTPFQVEIRERGAAKTQINQDDLLATFTPESVRPFTFPVFVSPDRKEDIAPDALGEVPLKTTEVLPVRHVPYHELVVPKYYEISGYINHDVGSAMKGYVPPGLAKPLRNGADDEIIKVTLPYHLQAEPRDNDVLDDDEPSILTTTHRSEYGDDATVAEPEEASEVKDRTSGLIPPPGLFMNPKFHKLQIFNRIPGMILHRLPLPLAETDSDSFLCPMPKNTMLPGATSYLDRKDVIKGVMGWKKVSSHGLGALSQTPTLMDVWLPRWSDSFSQAMVSTKLPEILNDLPEDDAANILIEDDDNIDDNDESSTAKQFPLLTPDMIQSSFATEEELSKEKSTTVSDESLKGDSLLSTRVSSEALQFSSKDQRQEMLEKMVSTRHDKLGSLIRDRILAFETEIDRP